MIVYFSTVVRRAPVDRGGEIVKLDWATKRVLARRPIFSSDPPINDANPRGGTRGGRGILLRDGKVLVASYHSVHVLDEELNEQARISNSLFANLHEIAWDGDGIWVSSTDIDGAVKVDLSGGTLASWWPREDPITAKRFSLTPLEIDKQADNRLRFAGIGNLAKSHVHLNAVAMRGRRPFVLLNRFGSVVSLNPTEIVLEHPGLRGSHNILISGSGTMIVNNTLGRSVEVFDLNGHSRTRVVLDELAPVRRILRRSGVPRLRAWLAVHGRPYRFFHRWFGDARAALPVFVRGLAETPSGTVLVGISPATILELDWRSGRLIDNFTYSQDVNVCIHGLAC